MRAEVWNRANDTKLADVHVDDRADLATKLVALRRCGKKLNEPGFGEIEVAIDHPAIAHMGGGNVLRLYDRNDAGAHVLVHSFQLSKRTAVLKAADTPLTFTVGGEGLMARWAESPVRPNITGAPVSMDWVLNYASPEQDRTSWGAVYTQLWSNSQWAEKPPDAWPFAPSFGFWILPREEEDVQPVGDYLMANDFNVPEDGYYALYLGFNSTVDVWVDGVLYESQPVKQPDVYGYQKTWRYVFYATAADDHVVVIKLTNWGGSESDNPAGVICSLARVTSSWTIGDGVFGSDGDSYNWVGLDRPNPFPGFTAPEIAQIFLDRAQAAGDLPGWTIQTHGTHEEIEEVAFRLTQNGLQVLNVLSEWADIAADDEGLVLHMWPAGEQGGDNDIAAEVGVNLTYLSESVDDEFYNAVQLTWLEGVVEREDSGSIAFWDQRRTMTRHLPGLTNLRAVNDMGDRILDAWSSPVTSRVIEIEPTAGARLGVNAVIGDTVDSEAVHGITWELRKDGLHPKAELVSVSARRQLAKMQAVEAAIAGYESPASAPPFKSDPRITNGQAQTWEKDWAAGGKIDDLLPSPDPTAPWQPWRPPEQRRLYQFVLEAGDSSEATGDTVATIMKNGGELNSIYRATITTSVGRDVVDIYYENLTTDDKISVGILEAGGHKEVTCTVRMAETV